MQDYRHRYWIPAEERDPPPVDVPQTGLQELPGLLQTDLSLFLIQLREVKIEQGLTGSPGEDGQIGGGRDQVVVQFAQETVDGIHETGSEGR